MVEQQGTSNLASPAAQRMHEQLHTPRANRPSATRQSRNLPSRLNTLHEGDSTGAEYGERTPPLH